MSQFEQENDTGRGGGEVDAETLEEAWRRREQAAERSYDDPVRDSDDLDEETERRS